MHCKTQYLMEMFFICIFSLFFTGCSSLNTLFKADPAPYSGFIQHPEQMEAHKERFPFNRIWCQKDGCDWSKYSSIIVAPVDTTHILKMSLWDNFNLVSKSKLEKDRQVIAEYTQKKFQSAIKTDVHKHHKVVDTPKKNTMILELALVELVPNKAFMRTAADIAGIFEPELKVIKFMGSGSVAIEGRIRDANTGEIIFKFADREDEKLTMVNINDFTWYGHAKVVVDDWASEFIELYDTPPSHMVEASSRFTLRPW